jgi:alkanesulfonate monooxygenase SsuD/methylene tetrahydromethanopterin reductase-like flavin-dependent oxidoreductase (luciferase family)
MTEPQQGLSYEEILAAATAAEASGLEAFFRSDHYTMAGETPLPSTDCWTTLAGLARDTRTIGLGSLVSPVTFRIPGSFAKVAATVDEMSGGRVEVGVGAGWNEPEHAQLGIPFPEVSERVDMMEEGLRILHGLWDEPDGWSSDGPRWPVREASFRPKTRRPRLIVGGTGKPRSLRIGARYADEYNTSSSGPDACREIGARLDEACRAIDRDPASITRSAMVGVLIAESEADLRDRVREQLGAFGPDLDETERWLAERRSRWVMGTRDEALERVHEFERAGVERVMLQDFLPRDLDMIRLMGRFFID